ncbi:MAG: DUF4129 domain-containing protein [Chloroflexi bacterium]|nr:DUF4129 domain-containing protein [Chloroflexota bacterium]
MRYSQIRRLTYIMLPLALLMQTAVAAQDNNTIGETEFWLRMQQTSRLVQQALSSGGSGTQEAIGQINALWENVILVQLENGTIIHVDTTWLRLSPNVTGPQLENLQARVTALVDFKTQHGGLPTQTENWLNQLKQVLKDRRFRYDGQRSASSPDSGRLSPISQIIMIVIGVLVAAGLLLYLGWALRIQPAAVSLAADQDETPTTSQAAVTLAERSEADQDYRAAIRYLYLACLLELDEHGTIHYNASLTNQEHLDQLRGRPQIRQRMESIVMVFDRVWYGFAPVDDGLYQGFRRDVEHLRHMTS